MYCVAAAKLKWRLLRTTGGILDQIGRQVHKNRLTAEASSVRVDRQLPAQDADVERIVDDGADVFSVFIVLAEYEPIPLQRFFRIGPVLTLRHVDHYAGRRVLPPLDRDSFVIAHVGERDGARSVRCAGRIST